eukprot:IDg19402t1
MGNGARSPIAFGGSSAIRALIGREMAWNDCNCVKHRTNVTGTASVRARRPPRLPKRFNHVPLL